MAKFVITGLPRSRTAWFAAYLTNGDTFCHHEAIFHNKSMDLEGYANVGNSDSGYVLRPEWGPEQDTHRIVVIHRDIDEVRTSLAAVGIFDARELLLDCDDKLDELKGFHVHFNHINDKLEDICNFIQVPYDRDRAELFKTLHIEPVDFTA